MEANHLTGTIPEAIASLESLYSLLLQQNSFSGEIDDEICWMKGLEISADCDEIECSCCDICCYECTDSPATNSNTLSPTDAVSISPTDEVSTSPTDAVSTTATPIEETNSTNSASMPESGSQPCSQIQLGSTCFGLGEAISFVVESCDAHEDDLIVMFEEGGDTTTFRDAVFWVNSCGEATCNGTMADGYMFMEDQLPQLLGLAPWPLDMGQYRLYLFRVVSQGVVDTLASSPLFRVHDELC